MFRIDDFPHPFLAINAIFCPWFTPNEIESKITFSPYDFEIPSTESKFINILSFIESLKYTFKHENVINI